MLAPPSGRRLDGDRTPAVVGQAREIWLIFALMMPVNGAVSRA
jgi:hypothetical protein